MAQNANEFRLYIKSLLQEYKEAWHRGGDDLFRVVCKVGEIDGMTLHIVSRKERNGFFADEFHTIQKIEVTHYSITGDVLGFRFHFANATLGSYPLHSITFQIDDFLTDIRVNDREVSILEIENTSDE